MIGLGRGHSVHYNRVLTNVVVEFAPPDLVAKQILPMFPVANSSDVFAVFDKRLFDSIDDTRADGSEAKEVERGWTFQQYLAETHALKTFITTKQEKNFDEPALLQMDVTEQLKQLVWNNYEVRVLGAGGVLRTAANNVYSANLNWSNLSTASPRTDVNAAISAVEIACGRTPNTVVMTKDVARQIMTISEWKEENKYTVNLSNVGSAADLPAQFWGLNAIYAQSLVNTAKFGEAPALSRIMGTDIWLGYVDTPGFRKLTFGATLQVYEEAASWFESPRKATAYEYETEYTPKVVAKECGALLTTVFS